MTTEIDTCVAVRKSLVKLTGDYKKAMVLGQMIYWGQRVRDLEPMVKEEKQRLQGATEVPQHGWIYKRAEDLSTETLMYIRPKAMRAHLKYLVNNEWLFERRYAQGKLDRTYQYRVNWVKIQSDLKRLGFEFKQFQKLLDRPEKDEKKNPKSLRGNSKTPEENAEKDRTENQEILNLSAYAYEEKPYPSLEIVNTQRDFSSYSAPEMIDTEAKETEIIAKTTDKQPLYPYPKEDNTWFETVWKEPSDADVVEELIKDLFGKRIPRRKVETLVSLAADEGMDWSGLCPLVKNTYDYHTKVEPCISIFGAIRYAIYNGGWDIPEEKMRPSPNDGLYSHGENHYNYSYA